MVKGKAWFRIKDPPTGEGQVGANASMLTPLKNHLIVFFPLPALGYDTIMENDRHMVLKSIERKSK